MSPWQKRARFVVAVFGLVAAGVVYFAIGRRPPVATPGEVKRIDPAASAESTGCTIKRFRGETPDFELTCKTQLAYPDGSLRMIDVTINVNKPDGRRYVVTAGEAYAGQDQKRLQLSYGVKLRASDGFEMTADRGDYDSEQGSIHSDVAVAFTKGRMSGSGTDIDYNENTDVLTIGQAARIVTVDDAGMTTLDFGAGTATLDRLHDVLTMGGQVHVLRDTQVMDADNALAHLAPNDEFVTYIELRGNSRVEGGAGSLEAMSARDIDLDYTDDGSLLERVVLAGQGGLALAGSAGAPGRQLMSELLDVHIASDGSITSATGREKVSMVLPATATSSARSINARTMDAAGAPGQGLTSATFSEAVEYREEASRNTALRVARARRLDLQLDGDAISTAAFRGEFAFEEPTFRAQSADARYDPTAGSLHLSGSDGRGLPCMADDQIAVDGQTIDVTVETRRLKANGRVKTTLRPAGASGNVGSSPCALARQRAAATAGAPTATPGGQTRLPGLLKQDQVATATSDALEYGGTGQSLVYTGSAYLAQGDTTIRGDVIRIDQEHGDLLVTGNAISRIAQGTGDERELVVGRAEEIQYEDSKRLISYRNSPGSAAKPPANKLVQVTSPNRTLTAQRIEIVLNKDDGKTERLEAYQSVTARIDTKTATADRLTYLADKDQYDMRGGSGEVRVTDGCSETVGKALTYSKAENRTVGIGNNVAQTQSKGAACAPPASSSR
jgi:lipopolysaccharide export system protein LptA